MTRHLSATPAAGTLVAGTLMAALPSTTAVQQAVTAAAAGRLIIVTDDPDREDEGDLVVAAEHITAEQVAFMVRHSTGIICAPMTAGRLDALRLPQMVTENSDVHGTAFTVTVDHMTCGTGVSAADRARTLRSLADRSTRPEDLHRPGHVFPLRAREGGVLARAGHTEAAVDLMRLAGREPVAVIGEIVAPDGSMARSDQLRTFAAEHGLTMLAIADLVGHRRATEGLVTHVAQRNRRPSSRR